MQLFCTIILLFYIGTIQTAIYGNLRKSLLNLLQREEPTVANYVFDKGPKISDIKQAKHKAEILQKARRLQEHLKHGKNLSPEKSSKKAADNDQFYKDPILNQMRRSREKWQINARRHDTSSETSSSSLEVKDWKEEFNDQWLMKKFEAVNSTDIRGDVVNMVAARPWGVPCGDPNQQDMPWGSCMMAAECDPEYRIFRGDIFCGRTQYVCCAIQLTNYDLYQGFDVSFADTSFSTDSAEKKAMDRGSKENAKRHKNRTKNKRMKERKRRKRQMKKNIRKIVHEIRKILNRSFRNATIHRKKRTDLLKKYIRDLKKQYKKDRKTVRDIHSNDLDKIDNALEKRLQQIKELNKNFLTNGTFRNIIVNGTMSKTGARMLAQAYPELEKYLRGRMRRDGDQLNGVETNELNDYLEYDIEYGALYY